MISIFVRYVLLLTSFLSSVLALPLVSRDVVDPPITSPTAATVWHVGQTQTVTWSTANLPVNQTNPIGMLVLGYMYNNSENLMLNSPLASNLNYSVGSAQITVPDVPSRTDYIVVLFGDSGNASPQFTIINDASPSASLTPSPVTTTPSGAPPASESTPASSPSPVTADSPNNVGASSPTPATVSAPATSAKQTATVPSSATTSARSSTVVTVTPSISPSSTQSSAAWQKHIPDLGASLTISFALIFFAFS